MMMFGVRVLLSHDDSGDGDGSNDDDGDGDGNDVMTVTLIKMMVVGWWDWSK